MKFDPYTKKTIALDFDGVMHSYTSGWKGADVIPDPPVPGMAQLCHDLLAMDFEVVIMTSRARYPQAPNAIGSWLQEHGFPLLPITAEKVPAEVYIDDRGFRFDGDASAILTFVKSGMTPWNKGAQIGA